MQGIETAASKDDRSVKILLADDQVFNLIVLEGTISNNFPNATFETAINGKQALEKVQECDAVGSPVEVIFMDIGMPEMDGCESSSLISKLFR